MSIIYAVSLVSWLPSKALLGLAATAVIAITVAVRRGSAMRGGGRDGNPVTRLFRT